MSLNRICQRDDMPTRQTVTNWIARGDAGEEPFKGFFGKYLRARELQADAIFDECLDIADNATDDVIFLAQDDGDGEGGKPAIKHSAIARSKLMIDTRMRMAGKLKPKKYGEKTTIAGDSEAPIKVDGKIEIIHVKP